MILLYTCSRLVPVKNTLPKVVAIQEHLQLVASEASRSGSCGGIAEGAVLARGSELIASSGNRTLELDDPIATAEMECIRKAGRRNDQADMTLYTSRCPDLLVAGTILQFSIGSVVVVGERSDSSAVALLEQKGVPVTFTDDQPGDGA